MDSSNFWKQELTREIRRLEQAMADEGLERLVERRSPFLERFALVTAVIMRRLNEVQALTEEVKGASWRVLTYPCTAPPPPRAWFAISEDGERWRQPIESHYALDEPRDGQLKLAEICNYLLHHFAFAVTHEPGTSRTAILFNSDRTKNRLFSIDLSDYLRLVEEVAFDQTNWVDMDQGSGRVVRRRRRPSDS